MSSIEKDKIPPAQLWIGSHEELSAKTEEFLQKHFCTHNACGICSTCRHIRERQFHSAIWLYPEKRYTLDQIKTIFETISFALADDQEFFFVIQKADCLTTASSNSLLKSVEEPPRGYHFIFLAERKDLILPTIRSRCTIQTHLVLTTEHEKENLLAFFKVDSTHNSVEFTKTLDSLKPNEQESTELLNNLSIYWMNITKKAIIDRDKETSMEATRKFNIIKKALLKPPMPGSSKIFWKNLFLALS